jgi:hypothetical protein
MYASARGEGKSHANRPPGVTLTGMRDPGLWWAFADKVGAPMFAATIVAALSRHEFGWIHLVLMIFSIALMAGAHWHKFHEH